MDFVGVDLHGAPCTATVQSFQIETKPDSWEYKLGGL